jgi:Meckel syndrome type 1 protein
MSDKRFWSGAVIVVTVAISGAGALPALLLRPSAPESAPIEIAAVAVKPADPKPVAVAPAPVPVALRSAPVALPAPEAVAAPTPVTPAPEATAVPPPEPPELPRAAAKPESFPPVQPADFVARPKAEPDVAPTATVTATPAASRRLARVRPAWHKYAGAKKARIARADTRVKRRARPAVYPIREFLAWRR